MNKRFLQISLTALFCASLFAACKKEETVEEEISTDGITFSDDTEDESENDEDTYKMEALVNGNSWKTNNATGYNNNDELVQIKGTHANGEVFYFYITNPTAKAYILNNASDEYAGFIINDTTFKSNNSSRVGGVVTITSFDNAANTISGEFEISCLNAQYDSIVELTEGTFTNISLIDSAITLDGIPSGNGNDNNDDNSDDDNNDNNDDSTTTALIDTFECNVDGSPLSTPLITGSIDSGYVAVGGGAVNYHPGVAILIQDHLGAGTYQFSNFTEAIGVYSIADTVQYFAASGSLDLISNDTINRRIRGSFSFMGMDINTYNMVNITDGYFAISY